MRRSQVVPENSLIGAVLEEIMVSEFAEEPEELKTALTKWGGGSTGFRVGR
jgi:hypothetical protein